MSRNFEVKKTRIEAVKIIQPKVLKDERGEFAEIYKASGWQEAGLKLTIKQVNYSRSRRGVIRGLHYQLKPKAQGKLVRVVSGEVFDVAVDLRVDSPTYGNWVGEILSAANRRMIYLPTGFAHGFAVRSDEAEVVYYCDEEYAPEFERGIKWNDEEMKIEWQVSQPIVSAKDQDWPRLREAENNFRL